jgi:hypothetical protein
MKNIKLFLKKYFIVIGSLFNIGIVFAVTFVFHHIYSSGLSLPLFSEKVKENLAVNQPNLYKILDPLLSTLSYFEVKNYYFRHVDLATWSGVGVSNQNVIDHYSSKNITEPIGLLDINKILRVDSAEQLISALKTVKSGQTILVAPGQYDIKQSSLYLGENGTAAMPISVTAQKVGTVKIFLKGEGIVVNKPYWQFSNLHFIGNCKSHTQCEHAFHVTGKGQHTVIKNNIMQDFNAMIKVNGVGEYYPDYGNVIGNTFFNRKVNLELIRFILNIVL